MGEYSNKNAQAILNNINACIEELDVQTKADYSFTTNWDRFAHKSYEAHKGWVFKIDAVCEELSIFDWWNDALSISMSQLKHMKKFLETAIELGFTGYVCFKVGASHCAHGMWAHKNESTTGYSPDGDVFFHSFRSGDNYFDAKLNGEWLHDKYADPEDPYDCSHFTLKQIKAELATV